MTESGSWFLEFASQGSAKIQWYLLQRVEPIYPNFNDFFQLLEEKGIEWARRNEELQRELRQALRSSIYDTEREVASVNTLEQVPLYFNWTLGPMS